MKYKVWNTKLRKMYSAEDSSKFLLDSDGDMFTMRLDLIDFVVPVYHVMTTKDGIEIYNSDIVEIDSQLYQIGWSMETGAGADLIKAPIWNFIRYVHLISMNIKVVGNSYENPELLEVEK